MVSLGHGHDFLLLVGPYLGSNDRDEFGKEKNTRLPLLLPRVMEGHPIASNSILFCLPAEILGDIMDLLAHDRASLAALALVNSDCRQLARSCQFANVCFDYSTNSTQLLLRLVEEARIRLGSDVPANATRPPFIGACIRSATVRPHPGWVAYRHSDVYKSVLGDAADTFTREQRDELSKQGFAQYVTTFRTPVLVALEQAMPNLEALSWCDKTCVDDNFFRIITHLRIRHLKLSKFSIGEPYRLELPLAPPAMPLESLSLGGASLCFDECHKPNLDYDPDDDKWNTLESRMLSPFTATLLQRCSATLRRFTFDHWPALFGAREPLSFGRERMVFPGLRHLNLSHYMWRLDAVAWSSLLSAPLTHFALPFHYQDPIFSQALSNCQPFRSLETLVVPSLRDEESGTAQALIDFISRHWHTPKVSVCFGAAQLMDAHLVPLLSDGRWSNLTSLSLEWEGPGIKEETAPNIATIAAESLAAVGSIATLEQLWLSAGISAGWRHQWLIDHDMVRSSLGGLARLKRLAFSRDTYKTPGDLTDHFVEGFYHHRLVTWDERDEALQWAHDDDDDHHDDDHDDDHDNDEGGPVLTDQEIWECLHRKYMVCEAEEYAAILPKLEWIFCGQWPMDIRNEKTSSGVRRVAVPLGEERDSCWTLLRRMFAMGEDDDE